MSAITTPLTDAKHPIARGGPEPSFDGVLVHHQERRERALRNSVIEELE